MAPLWARYLAAFPHLGSAPNVFARAVDHPSRFVLLRGGPERPPNVLRRARLAASHGVAVLRVFPSDPLLPSCLRRQIWNERTRLDTPSGLHNRSTGTRGLGPLHQVSTRPCPRGTPNQSRAAACHPVSNTRSNHSQPRLFCSLAPRFSRNQPAV